MKTKTIKYSILILVILLINNIALGIVWMEKKEAILFHYYVWRNRHASDIASIEQYQSKVDSIAPYIFPLLVQTYMDVNASHSDRHIVALALIKVDKEKAEALFMHFLDSKDNKILRSAIYDLIYVKSKEAYEKIIKLSDHPSEKVRRGVAEYLRDFKNEETITLFKHMMENDKSDIVKIAARGSLYTFGLLLGAEDAVKLTIKELVKLGYNPSEMYEATYDSYKDKYSEMPNNCILLSGSEQEKKLLDRHYWTVYFYPETRIGEYVCVYIDDETREILGHTKGKYKKGGKYTKVKN